MTLALGMFDILQIDPLAEGGVAQMYADRLETLALADEVGLDAAFVAERHYQRAYACPSASVLLAAATQRTKRMRLGCMAYTVALRDPVHLAEDIAMLTHLAPRRIEVGAGLGHNPQEFTQRGRSLDDRYGAFHRNLAIVQHLINGEQISVTEPDLVIDGLSLAPGVDATTRPPLWFAGNDVDMVSGAAENGIGVCLGFRPTGELAIAAEQVRKSWQGDDQRPLGHLGLMRNVIIAPSDDEARAGVIDDLTRLDTLVGQAKGDPAEQRAICERRIDDMIASDIMWIGSPETVASTIREARATLGFDLFLAHPYAAAMSKERVQQTVRLLATDVRQRLAD